MLQQGDTAVIYPQAPEDEPQRQGTPDASIHDENGTPDSFSQLLTCPYCARGYKRYSSLKEHIKYRHEKTEESFGCPECGYSFAHRAQLERHMTVHKSGRDQRLMTQSGGNRKFKCTECGKAFKYKHHLKEHLRIHSGEKPYECSNCKKRFSHSGSYSSHISSKKCIGVISVNGRARLGNGKTPMQGLPPVLPRPPPGLRPHIREKLEHSKPLQEQLPLNQIKTEPVDYEYKPTVTAVNGGIFNGGTVQAVVLPTVGLVSPISINLADLQNALQVAVDGRVIRQVLESNAKGHRQVSTGLTPGALHAAPQQLISAISLPLVGQDGNAKIIINYSLDPNQGQLTPQNLKKEPGSHSHTQTPTDTFKSQKPPEDLTISGARPGETKDDEAKTTRTCLLCDHCPGGMDALHALNGASLEKSESAVAALLSEGGLCSQPKNLLSLLKAYFALNTEPSKDELTKISDSVSLPMHVVKKWFDKMLEGQISLGAPTPPSEEEDTCNADNVVSLVPGKETGIMSPSVTQASPTEATPAEINGAASPLNLTAGCDATAQPPQDTEGPLDLSLPKAAREETERLTAKARVYPAPSSRSTNVDEPLNLTCTRKEVLPLSAMGSSPIALYASTPSATPLDIVTTMQCLRALASHNKHTILIPQLAYTYTTTASSPAGAETPEVVTLNGVKEENQDMCSEGVPTLEEQNDSDSGPQRKRMKKSERGVYACDLCDKIFQKSSSLLRHKYEHTGKRPHECSICRKAFKHKHHLIEHLRLHSGEKPYQCDKCGKRFSHSGSYSQHMNHRYSYCKKEMQSQGGGQDSPEEDSEAQEEMEALSRVHNRLLAPSLGLDLDERGSSTREDEESEEESEKGVVDMDHIQMVQIGDEGGDEEELEKVLVEGGEEGEKTYLEMKEEEEGLDTRREEAGGIIREEEEEELEEDVATKAEDRVAEEWKAEAQVAEESGGEANGDGGSDD
ncbi:zinc finger E-box-binding homeobox 1b [Brachionichthys hirsutus]|uniref:zinc finger E-box-binding homeobox 1b n=1 Tax=Brachionichthys hirsutus TaxID=412623 RepID=UPI00360433C6